MASPGPRIAVAIPRDSALLPPRPAYSPRRRSAVRRRRCFRCSCSDTVVSSSLIFCANIIYFSINIYSQYLHSHNIELYLVLYIVCPQLDRNFDLYTFLPIFKFVFTCKNLSLRQIGDRSEILISIFRRIFASKYKIENICQ